MGKRYALITGASGGIGKEIAEIFAAEGHDLILAARRKEKLEELKAYLEEKYAVEVFAFPIDLSKKDAAEELHEKTRGLAVDNLVNNAGFGDFKAFMDSENN